MSETNKVTLPPLEPECNEEDVLLRAARWTERVFEVIDDDDFRYMAEGDAANHAGIDAEWDLIQRERSLRAEIALRVKAEDALAEAVAETRRVTTICDELAEESGEFESKLTRLSALPDRWLNLNPQPTAEQCAREMRAVLLSENGGEL